MTGFEMFSGRRPRATPREITALLGTNSRKQAVRLHTAALRVGEKGIALIWGAAPIGDAIIIYHRVLPIYSGFRPGTISIMYDTSIMYISPLCSPLARRPKASPRSPHPLSPSRRVVHLC